MQKWGEPSGETSGEVSGDQSPDVRWLTYAEIGHTRGIGRESAVKLVQRKRWRRVRGNDGEARIGVPLDWLTPAKSPSEDIPPKAPRSDPPSPPPDITRIVDAFDGAVASLTNRAEVAEKRAERAETEAADLRQTLDQARTAALEAKAEAASQRALLKQAAEGLTTERAAREAAEAEAVRIREDAEKVREAARTAEAEAAQLRKEAEQARAEAAEAVRTAETLRAEKGRTTEAAAERALQVASRIDEAQFRRLQEADEARRGLSLWGQLRTAWRGM